MQSGPLRVVHTICKTIIITSILVDLGLGAYFAFAQQKNTRVTQITNPQVAAAKVLGLTDSRGESNISAFQVQQIPSSLNLLANTSFEAGNVDAEPKSWGYTDSAGSGNTQVSTMSVRSGNLALRVSDAGASASNPLTLGISQPQNSTINGRTYTLSVYLRTAGLAGVPKLRLGFQGGQQPGQEHGGKDVFKDFPLTAGATSDWKNFTFTYSSAALGKYPSIEIVDYKGGVIFLDDATMYGVGSASGSPALYQAITKIGDGALIVDAQGNLYPASGYSGTLGLDGSPWSYIYGQKGNFSSDVSVGGQFSASGAVNLGGSLKVNGETTFGGPVNISSFSVSGSTSFVDLTASGNADIAGSLYAGANNDFAVDTTGNLTGIRGVAYSWPGSQGGAGTFLQNDGSGALTWATFGAGSIPADSLDFTEFKDSMTLDASTDIGVTGSDVFSVTNSGSGLSFRVNDQTSDTTPFVVDASGLVGIGTASPTVGLTVFKDIGWTAETNSALATFRRTSTDDGIAIGYWSHNGLADGGGAITAMGGSSLILGTDTNPRSLSVYSNGRVFIGQTVSPNTDQLLTINGGLTVAGSGTAITESTTYPSMYGADIIPGNLGSGDLVLSGRNSANQSGIAFVTGASGTSALRMFITYDGKVSIGGTSAPANKLDIRDASSGDVLTLGGTAAVTTKLGFTAGGNSYLDAVNTGILHLRTNGSDRLTINASGNVGIGTTSPGGRLHVYTGASGQATPYSSGDELVVEGSGATGINILSPNTTLQRITFGDNTSAAQGILVYNHTNDSFGIGTNGNDGGHFYINSSGNIGIGTTSVGARLDVKGQGTAYTDKVFRVTDSNSISLITTTGDGRTYIGADNGTNAGLVVNNPSGTARNIASFKDLNATGTPELAIIGATNAIALNLVGTSGKMYFGNNGLNAQEMTLDTATGNFVVGSNSPTGRLQSTISSAEVTATNFAGYFQNLATNTTTDAIDKYGMYVTSTGTYTGLSGTTTNNYGLYVATPTGADNNYAAVFQSGNVGIGNTTPSYQLDISSPGAGAPMFRAVRAATSRGLTLTSDGQATFVSSVTTLDGIFNFSLENPLARETSAGNTATGVKFTIPITLTAGSDTNNSMTLNGTVNQSAGTGITRGLYINQTITAASDYRALEIGSGKAIFNGSVGIGTTSATGQLTMTGTAKNAQGTFLNLTDNVDNNDANYPARILFVDNNGAVASHMRKGLQVDFSGTSTFTDRSITALITNSLVGSQAITFGSAETGNNALQVKTTGSTAGGNRAGMFMASGGATNVGAEVIASGTATTNIAGYFSASGGTSNYAFVVPSTGGNVGIGTTAPTKLLHVQKSDSDTTLSDGIAATVRVSNSDATTGTFAGIEFGQYGSDYTHAFVGAVKTSGTTTGTSDLIFATKASTSDNTLTEYMRIASGGNVGIGTPSSGNKLDVNGNMKLTNNGQLYMGNGAAFGGVTGPVIYWGSTTSSAANVAMGLNGSGGNSANSGIFFPDRDTIGFSSSGTEIMRIGNGSNVRIVGIGTTAPTSPLHVSGAYSDAAAMIVNQVNSGKILVASASGATRFSVAKGTNSTNDYLEVSSNGQEMTLQPVAGSGTPSVSLLTSAGNGGNRALTVQQLGGLAIGNYTTTTVPTPDARTPLLVPWAFSSSSVDWSATASVFKISSSIAMTGTTNFTGATYFADISPTINLSTAGTKSGSYQALHIGVSETALPSGQNYLLWAGAGASGTTAKFTVTNAGATTMASTLTLSGTTSCGSGLQTDGSGVVSCISSDERLKTNIQQIQDPLSAISQLRGVTYNWKDSNQGSGLQYGFIAQDVEKIVPGLTFTAGDGVKGVKYQQMVGLVVEGMKQQQQQIQSLQAQLSGSSSAQTFANMPSSTSTEFVGLSYSLPNDTLTVTKIIRFTQELLVDAAATFSKPVKFLSDVVFQGKVIFGSDVTFASNSGGEAIILPGSEKVDVVFSQEFRSTPVVTANVAFHSSEPAEMVKNAKEKASSYVITNVSTKGFTIVLKEAAATELHYNWMALQVAESSPSVSAENAAAPSVSNVLGSSTQNDADASLTPSATPSATPTSTETPAPTPTSTASASASSSAGVQP